MSKLKLKEKKDEIYDSVIEKSGITTEFTIHQLLDHLDYTKKKLKETEGQIRVNIQMDAIAEGMVPALKDLVIAPEHLQSVIEYFVRKNSKAEYENLLGTCQATLASYKKELLAIEDAFGIMMPPTVRE